MRVIKILYDMAKFVKTDELLEFLRCIALLLLPRFGTGVPISESRIRGLSARASTTGNHVRIVDGAATVKAFFCAQSGYRPNVGPDVPNTHLAGAIAPLCSEYGLRHESGAAFLLPRRLGHSLDRSQVGRKV